MRQLVGHGPRNDEERVVHVDVRLHREGEEHAADIRVRHQLGCEHRLRRRVQRPFQHRVLLGQLPHGLHRLLRVLLELAGFGIEQVRVVAQLRPRLAQLVGERCSERHKLLLALSRINVGLLHVVTGVLGEGVPVVVQPAQGREQEVHRAADGHDPHRAAVGHHEARALAHDELANAEDEVAWAEQQEQRRNPLGHREAHKRRQKSHDAGQRRVHALGVHVLRPIGILPRVRSRRKRDDAERYEQHPLEQELPYAALRFVGFHRVTV